MRVRHLWSGLSVACAAALVSRHGCYRVSGQSGAPHAVGRSRHPGHVHQHLRERHAARAARRVCGTDARPGERRGAGEHPARDPEADDRGVPRPRARARQLVAGQPLSRSRQPGVACHRSARRQNPAADARSPEEGAGARRRAEGEHVADRPTRTRIAASTIAASLAACPVR